MIWYGIISEVKDTKARVLVDGLTTDYLPVFQMASSFKRTWIPITVNEQCIILSPTGNINNATILRGLYYSDLSAPCSVDTIEKTVYSDDTEVSYDSANHELVVNAVKAITIKCESATITATDKVLVTTSNGDVSVTASKSDVSVTASEGNVLVTADKDVSVTASKGDVSVKSKTAKIDATDSVTVTSKLVDLGGAGGLGVVTSSCNCYLFGVPHKGSTKVKAID